MTVTKIVICNFSNPNKIIPKFFFEFFYIIIRIISVIPIYMSLDNVCNYYILELGNPCKIGKAS